MGLQNSYFHLENRWIAEFLFTSEPIIYKQRQPKLIIPSKYIIYFRKTNWYCKSVPQPLTCSWGQKWTCIHIKGKTNQRQLTVQEKEIYISTAISFSKFYEGEENQFRNEDLSQHWEVKSYFKDLFLEYFHRLWAAPVNYRASVLFIGSL